LSNFERISHWFLIGLTISTLIGVWVSSINLETQYIPTVINGIATSQSLILGFIATGIAIIASRPLEKQKSGRLILIIPLLLFPITLLVFTYVFLMAYEDHLYVWVLKMAMTGLVLSLALFTSFITFLIRIISGD